MSRRSSLSLALALALSTAACAADPGLDAEDVGSSESAIWILGTANGTPPEWDSTVTTNLSAWQSVMCVQDYGNNFLPTQITGWIDKGSMDQYLARAEVTCTQYVGTPSSPSYVPTGVEHTQLLMSSSYDGSGIPADIFASSSDAIPAGVHLGLNSGGDYLQDLQILFVHPQRDPYLLASYGTPDATEPTPIILHLKGYEMQERQLICPDQQVMSGVAVKTSTGSGKVRALKIYCRPLSWQ